MNVAIEPRSLPLATTLDAEGDNLGLAAKLEALSNETMEKVDAAGSVSRASFSSKASFSSSAGKWSIADEKPMLAPEIIVQEDSQESRARFAEDLWGHVKCFKSADPEPIYEDEVASRWFSLDDFAAVRDEVRSASEATWGTDYHLHFKKIYQQCGEGPEEELLTAEVEESASVVARSLFRGLELTLFDRSMRRDNSEVTWSVIDAQDIVRNSGQSREKREKVLAAVSRKLSKRARRVAFVLGVGDMIVAEEILGFSRNLEVE